jgi:hypothetical protein
MKLKLVTVTAFLCAVINHYTNAQTVSHRKNNQTNTTVASRTIAANEWTTGAMPDTTGNGTPTTANLKQLLIANTNLKPLGVTLGGPNLIVCNNPERFTGDGWLFQHSYTDATQGGVDYPLSGITKIYMFHLNYTSPGATKYVHLVVHNPGASSVTYSSKGRHYTNVDFPLSGGATGQSYNVSKDWLSNSLATATGTINAGAKLVVFSKQVNSANMFDALYEIETSGPVYYYTVVTTNNTAAAARSAAGVNQPYASFAVPPDPRVTQSDYRQETGGTYARGAGVFPASEVNSDNVLVIPDVPSRIGFCFNTSSKFFPMLEKQNPAVLVKTPPTTDSVRSLYSSSHNYGNYGMKYNTVFHLQNNNSVDKTVNIYFAENENLVDAASTSGAWNSRFKTTFNSSVTTPDIYIQRNNPRKLLRTVTVPAGTSDFTLEVYIPGLITTNHQLIFETTTTAPSTLPVTLTAFDGKEENGSNRITWKTEQEINLSHYDLERKTDNGNFVLLKRMNALNSASAITYVYNDTITGSGKKQYRLKMVNDNGTFQYSSIITLSNKQQPTTKVLGNPFTDKLTVQFKTAGISGIQLQLFTSEGKLLRSVILKETSSSYSFYNLQSLKAGNYILKTIYNNTIQSIPVIKTN